MIKDINIRFNLDKDEHRKAWGYMQAMDRTVEKSYSKVIIKSLIQYFESADARTDEIGAGEGYWERFRSEMGKLLQEHLRQETIVSIPVEAGELAEKTDDNLPIISEDVLDALEDLF